MCLGHSTDVGDVRTRLGNLTKAMLVLVTLVNATIKKKEPMPPAVVKILFPDLNMTSISGNQTEGGTGNNAQRLPPRPRSTGRELAPLGQPSSAGPSLKERHTLRQLGEEEDEDGGTYGWQKGPKYHPAKGPGYHPGDPDGSVLSELMRIANRTTLLKFLHEKQSAPPVSGKNWDIIGSVFYCATILTTCGFGSYYPETPEGRIFTVIYTVFMLSMSGYIMSELMHNTVLYTMAWVSSQGPGGETGANLFY